MVLHTIFIFNLEVLMLLLLIVLLLDDLGLLGFLTLAQVDGLLNLSLLILPLLGHHVVLVGNLALLLIGHLVVIDFLLNTLLIAAFEHTDFVGTLASILDLLPGLHFFLLEKGNTVSQQLGVTLNPNNR